MLNKPINPSPHNCCVNPKNVTFEYEIPNNETIDGAYLYSGMVNTGELRGDSYKDFSDNPTNKFSVSWSELKEGDRFWQTFYWKNPTVDGEKHTIVGVDSATNEIIIKPKGNPVLNKSLCKENETSANEFLRVELGTMRGYSFEITEDMLNTLQSNTSSKKNYIGQPCFCVPYYFSFCSELVSEIGYRIVELYDTNNILIGRAKILAAFGQSAFDYEDPVCFIIVDNAEFCDAIQTLTSYEDTNLHPMMTFYEFGRIKIYREINLVPSVESGSLLKYNDNYYMIKSIRNADYNSMLSVKPDISVNIGDTIEVWTSETAEFNTSPAYYFRVKSPPTTLNISAISTLFTSSADGDNTLSDIKCGFKVEYASDYKLNYFYLYCYAHNPNTYEWELQERSPMLFNINEAYEFACFVPGQEYKVYAVCIDKDGDEWTTEDIEFVNSLDISNPQSNAKFNKTDNTIDVDLTEITYSNYPNVGVDIYKALKCDTNPIPDISYVGGGTMLSNDLIIFNNLKDYNICNDSYYDYYIRYETSDGIIFTYIKDIHTEFENTSIIGLKEIENSNLVICNTFNLKYHLNNDLGEITNEISREYIGTFGKYPKELKGHQNYISSSCSGLLGDEKDGIYAEPKAIRNAWINFTNDDNIKLYRGLDGITAIISIESSRIKPYDYPNVGIVNEVYMTFKEIAPVEKYAIFTTEWVGG